jgi:hypothetical protein
MAQSMSRVKTTSRGKAWVKPVQIADVNDESIPTSVSASPAMCRLLLMAMQWEILAEEVLSSNRGTGRRDKERK